MQDAKNLYIRKEGKWEKGPICTDDDFAFGRRLLIPWIFGRWRQIMGILLLYPRDQESLHIFG